eukprot:CAMPEP_0197689466 /NCGR_PEP_ID=MMETSP1338-20131121/106881_1 /TAXON_ID=43686 ORGANISM="Pelagodinium beii, Strain RCC1491" /NCGR_SAMPLE_ID=MMETSP1338 /ASSEMBLY_ACC=CAM_ASM_000754 /LENGTH=250 /DNA_ID=CAMNT_0043271801 /DNA_START=35 /DNA_END=784 /DNA_ORIENTATION=-
MYKAFYLKTLAQAKGDHTECHHRIVTQQVHALLGRKARDLPQGFCSLVEAFVDVGASKFPSALELRSECRNRVTRRLRSLFAHLRKVADTQWHTSARIHPDLWLEEGSRIANLGEWLEGDSRIDNINFSEEEEILLAAGFTLEKLHPPARILLTWEVNESPQHSRAPLAHYSHEFQQEVKGIVADLRVRTTLSLERKLDQLMEDIFRDTMATPYNQVACVEIRCSEKPLLIYGGNISTVASIDLGIAASE